MMQCCGTAKRNELMKKWCLALLALVVLTGQSHAQIGSTLEKCEQHYGKPVSEPNKNIDPGVIQYHFVSGKLDLYVRISTKTHLATVVYYSKVDRGPFSNAEIMRLLQENGEGLKWLPQHAEQPASADEKDWIGQQNGKTVLTASYRLMEEGEGYVLNVWVAAW
jgi:hypothetical protein